MTTEQREIQEGDKCIYSACNGVYYYGPVVDCYCHVSPPCSNCLDNPLICSECGEEA